MQGNGKRYELRITTCGETDVVEVRRYERLSVRESDDVIEIEGISPRVMSVLFIIGPRVKMHNSPEHAGEMVQGDQMFGLVTSDLQVVIDKIIEKIEKKAEGATNPEADLEFSRREVQHRLTQMDMMLNFEFTRSSSSQN